VLEVVVEAVVEEPAETGAFATADEAGWAAVDAVVLEDVAAAGAFAAAGAAGGAAADGVVLEDVTAAGAFAAAGAAGGAAADGEVVALEGAAAAGAFAVVVVVDTAGVEAGDDPLVLLVCVELELLSPHPAASDTRMHKAEIPTFCLEKND